MTDPVHTLHDSEPKAATDPFDRDSLLRRMADECTANQGGRCGRFHCPNCDPTDDCWGMST